jgi:predicted ester cyclase
MSTPEENKAIIRRLYEEVFNEGKLDVLEEIQSEDAINHTYGFRGRGQGVKMLRERFPEFHIAIEDQVSEGDKVATRITIRATDSVGVFGRPPTGRQITIVGILIRRIADGKITDTWECMDQFGVMQQLGALPAPGQSG